MLEVLQAVSCIKKNQSWKIKYTTKREDEGGKMERKREKSLTWFNGNSFFLEMHLLSSYKDRKSHWRCNIITSVLFLCASVAFLTRMLAFIHSAQHQANMILFFVSGWCFFFRSLSHTERKCSLLFAILWLVCRKKRRTRWNSSDAMR